MPPVSLAIIMPVYDEAATVERAIERILETPAPHALMRSIIAVDDGSRDGSGEVLDELDQRHHEVTALHHERNLGKGAAVGTGLVEAGGADIVLIHDADLEYDPHDHERLLEPIVRGRADAVVGTRFMGASSHRVLYYWHSVANRVVSTMCNAMTNLNLTDIECCSKAFTREMARKLVIEESGFGVEVELIAKFARMRMDGQGRAPRIFEVPISYAGRTYEEGKKIRARDGLEAIWCILRYGLGPHAQADSAGDGRMRGDSVDASP